MFFIYLKYRCEALNFELSKSQKKIIKKVTKFLKSGEYDKSTVNIEQVEREPQMKCEFHGNCIPFFNFMFCILKINISVFCFICITFFYVF